jgi:hypothetical protein
LANEALHESPAQIEPTVTQPQNVIARYGDPPTGFPSEQWRCTSRAVIAVSQLRVDRFHHLVGIDIER